MALPLLQSDLDTWLREIKIFICLLVLPTTFWFMHGFYCLHVVARAAAGVLFFLLHSDGQPHI